LARIIAPHVVVASSSTIKIHELNQSQNVPYIAIYIEHIPLFAFFGRMKLSSILSFILLEVVLHVEFGEAIDSCSALKECTACTDTSTGK